MVAEIRTLELTYALSLPTELSLRGLTSILYTILIGLVFSLYNFIFYLKYFIYSSLKNVFFL